MLLDAPARHSAKKFLQRFASKTRKSGQAIFSAGGCGPIVVLGGGKVYSLLDEEESQPDQPEVQLLAGSEGWSAKCECGGPKCEHAVAALMFLLETADTELFREPARGSAEPRDLGKLISECLGRKLTLAEKNIVAAIRGWFQPVRHGGIISKYELSHYFQLNWYEAPGKFTPRECPENELDLWHEIAAFLMQCRGRIPEFLNCITDRNRVEKLKRLIQREEEISQWQQTFSDLSRSGTETRSDEMDLRVVVRNDRLSLECKRGEDASFRPVSGRMTAAVARTAYQGDLKEEAWPVFHAFSNLLEMNEAHELPLGDEEAQTALSGLMRQPQARERVVDEAGNPFAMLPGRLSWELKPDGGGDYRLQLVDGEGKAPGPFRATLPGRPTLYLCLEGIYQGPAMPSKMKAGPHHIPAPALETQEGVQMLATLGVPLPENLEQRTTRVTKNVVIECGLKLGKYGANEICTARITATGASPLHLEEYTVAGWNSKLPAPAEEKQFFIFDRRALHRVPELMAASGFRWDAYSSSWGWKVTRNFAEKFVEWLRMVPSGVEVQLKGELASLTQGPLRAKVTLECEEAGVDWFDLKTAIRVEDATLTPEELKLLLSANGKAVRLPGKGWRRVEYELTETEDAALAKLGLNPHDFSAEPQRLHALQLADKSAEEFLAAEQFRKIQVRASEIKARVSPPVPESIRAELRPYQVEGFHFLAYLSENSFGGVLADDMGLGKTLQTLCWLAWVRERTKKPKPSLVVCPKSVMDNWAAEAVKFLPGLRVRLWRSNESEPLENAAQETDLVVVNYSQLRSFSPAAEKLAWEAVILDEAQAIKNPSSQTAQSARNLRAGHRLALSGTPIENRLLDLWSIMAFAMPGILGNRTEFRKRYDQGSDKLARKRLAARVRPFLLRRTKSQVAAELPDRIEEDLVCELEGTQKTLYRAEFKRAQQMLLRVRTQAALNEFRFHFLTSLLRLRQICCHPALVDLNLGGEESAKLNAMLELLEPLMEEGHKVLVFSQFVTMLDILQKAFQERGWKTFYLSGATENRGELVKEFQEQDGAAIFLISLKAGGFGLNLTSASYVVLYDPWWNPAVESQAIDRTHRIGQTEKVIAYRLLIKGSIEEKIRTLQRQKSSLADDVLGEEAFASSLTLADLQYLFAEEPVVD